MLIPDSLRDCTCYIAGKRPDGTFKIGGTGFFVHLKSGTPADKTWIYLVTARHCVKGMHRAFGNLFIRINSQRTGAAEYIQIKGTWMEHPRYVASDVAVIQFEPTEDARLELNPINLTAVADAQNIRRLRIGIGDETIMIGMFASRQGKDRNLPIVRGGMISAMPEEMLLDQDTGCYYSAFLVEIRSISGLSGSPVLVWVPDYRLPEDLKNPRGYLFLLGMIRGHFAPDVHLDFLDKPTQFNTGISIVIPIQDIVDIIDRDPTGKGRDNELLVEAP
jgi:hypothetical protein